MSTTDGAGRVPSDAEQHEVDPMTDYCLRCGMPMYAIVERQQLECAATPNVAAISHTLCRARLNRLCGTSMFEDTQR